MKIVPWWVVTSFKNHEMCLVITTQYTCLLFLLFPVFLLFPAFPLFPVFRGDYSSRGLRGTLKFYTYKASECKHAIIRLHCATSKSSLWNMEYVAHGSAFEHPHIYRTSTCIYTCTLDTCDVHVMYTVLDL